jgi:hypothetical protein
MTNEPDKETALKFLAAEGQKCDRMDALKELLAKVEAIAQRGKSISRATVSYRRQHYGKGLVDASVEIADELRALISEGK